MALRDTSIDPASFTSVRLVTGALTLMFITGLREKRISIDGNWYSSGALLAYAACFSFAYLGLTAGTGALLLFGAVQVVMIGAGIAAGERIRKATILGWLLAVGGLVILVLPGVSAAPARDALLMLCAGIAWGIYSIRGRRSVDPLRDTAGNFAHSIPGTLLLSAAMWEHRSWDAKGVALGALSGALASGLGYAVWYTVLPRISAIGAASAQLSVPVIAALGGVALFGEPITIRLAISAVLVLGGIALTLKR